MDAKVKSENKGFYITESILLILSLFFAFVLVGYRTIALVILGVAFVIGIYKYLSLPRVKNKKAAKPFKIFFTCILCLGLIVFIVFEIPIINSARTDDDPKADYLIVLGAGVNGKEPSLSLLNRLEAAEDYLNTYENAKVVVSGGKGPGEEITEALCMKNWLLNKGISDDRIILEEKAKSTKGNVAFSLNLISKDGGNPKGKIAIVSSEYHLYRAKLIATEQGCIPLGVAGKTSYPILKINYFIREAAAVAYMKVFGSLY